jgi:antitoxin component of RelBE/YafQ-DinJ toxin-antitoxin module
MKNKSTTRDIDKARETIRRPVRIDPERTAALNIRDITYKLKQNFKAVCAKEGISMHHAVREYIDMCIQQGCILTVAYYDLVMENKALKIQIVELNKDLEEYE